MTAPESSAAAPFGRPILYRAIIDSATDYAIIAADLAGRIIEWNIGAEVALGWSAEEILGKAIAEIFTPEDRAAGVPEAEMSKALLTGHAMDLRWHLRRDGSRFWADGRMMALVDDQGLSIGYLKIVRDETSRKLSTTQAMSATALRLITDHVETAIIQVDLGGAVVFANPAAERLTGWSSHDLMGRSVDTLIEPDTAAAPGPAATLVEAYTDRDMRLGARDGPGRFVTCSRTAIMVDGQRTGDVLTMQDASRRRQADEAMRAEVRRHEVLGRLQRAVESAWGDIDAIYAAVLQGALDIMAEVDAVSVELLDGEATVNHMTTDPARGEVGMRVPLAGSLTGAALASGQAVVCPDTDADPRVDRERARRYAVRAMIVVPIPRAGRFVGALKFSASRPGSFAPRDLLVAQILVGHIATAYARTDEARALRDLQASEERLQLALQASGTIGIWDWDIPNDRCFGDARLARMLGVDPARAAEGLPIAAYVARVHAEDMGRTSDAARRAMAGSDEFATECRVVGDDGAVVWLAARGRVYRGTDGAPTRFLGAAVDITERKGLEAALREDEQRFRAMAEGMPQLAWMADPAGTIGWFNQRWFDYVGHGEGMGMPGALRHAVHADLAEALKERLGAALRDGVPWEDKLLLRGADGGFRWFLSRALPLKRPDGSILRWFGTHTDIDDEVRALEAQARFGEDLERQVNARTEELSLANQRLMAEMAERQAAEEALRQSQKMEAVGQLTGGIAHDFNNLLTGITGSLDLMRKRIDQGRIADVERYIAAATTSAGRAAALTHRLLAFARRQPLDAKPVDLNALTMSMEDLFRRTLGESIEIVLQLSPDLWTTLCDPHQLENALLNLVINARDAMPSGGRLTIATMNTRLADEQVRNAADRRSGDFVSLIVADTGHGMTAETQQRIFEPFFTTKPIGQGTGLGLSMIYGFARQSDGHVDVESQPDEGTRFTVRLPRFAGTVGELDEGADRPPFVAGGAGETVLVVEDDPVVRGVVLDVLSELGYRTLEAHEGLAGLAILQGRARVDLLVTDVGLPGLNGRQLAEFGRAARPGLKVLFITGYAEDSVFGRGPSDSGMQMITKPFAVDQLAARIRVMLAGAG